MESIDVVTGQHVTIAYKAANAFERGAATLVDWLIQGIYVVILNILLSFSFGTAAWIRVSHENLIITFYLILIAPLIFYNFLFEAFLLNGQTPGKKLFRLKVTKTDGTAISTGQHFLRWLLRPIDFFPFLGGLGMFFIFYTKKKQRLGDLAADTVVVKTYGKIDIGAEYYDFDENYRPSIQRVEELNDAQVRYIVYFLDMPEKLNKERITDLSQKVKAVLDTGDIRMSDRDFLKLVVKDYNYTTSLGL